MKKFDKKNTVKKLLVSCAVHFVEENDSDALKCFIFQNDLIEATTKYSRVAISNPLSFNSGIYKYVNKTITLEKNIDIKTSFRHNFDLFKSYTPEPNSLEGDLLSVINNAGSLDLKGNIKDVLCMDDITVGGSFIKLTRMQSTQRIYKLIKYLKEPGIIKIGNVTNEQVACKYVFMKTPTVEFVQLGLI